MGQLIGIDIGGTFTDFVLVDPETQRIQTHKVPSIPSDPAKALVHGLGDMRLETIDAIVHATTVATNAILERKGACCGLIATRGFRDVLELRRRDRPHAYGLTGSFEPLIPRDRRVEVEERVGSNGEILVPVDIDAIAAAAHALLERGVEGIVVAFMNAYANPINEQKARDAIKSIRPDLHVSCSSEVLPLFREFERTSTATVNAYIQPVVSRYLHRVQDRLKSATGYARSLLVMQANGGMLDIDALSDFPVHTVLSGPAAGVMGAVHLAAEHGVDRLITYDMGGTSLDVALVSDGKPERTSGTEVEFGIPIETSMIDVRAIGAGGGSIAWIDASGILQIGPQSAGGDPGPVCYGAGGQDPTVTDALVVLGRINPGRSITGVTLDVALAHTVLKERIGGPLELSTEEAAAAIITVASNRISGSLRRVSIDRGHDPRDFSLFPFGGCGPLFACQLLQDLKIEQAIIPTFPGIASAWGCLVADVRRDFVRMFNKRLTDLDLKDVEETIRNHTAQGRQFVEATHIPTERVTVTVDADVGFEGQTHVVRTPLPIQNLDASDIREAFRAAYDKRYGVDKISFEGLADLLDEIPIRVLNVRTSVVGVRPEIALKSHLDSPVSSLAAATTGDRRVFVDGRFQDCPTFDRKHIPWGAEIAGPAVIEQKDCTVWIEPRFFARVLEGGALRLAPESR